MDEQTKTPEKLRILLVDDVGDNLRILYDCLQPEGYELLTATAGENAIQLIHKAKPDLILLDIMMPGLNGFETCERLKKNPLTQTIPIIFITGRDDAESLRKAFDVGGVDYITKPFEQSEIIARVRTHLKIHTLSIQLQNQVDALTRELTRRRFAEQARDLAESELRLLHTSRGDIPFTGSLIGNSAALNQVKKRIEKLQRFPTHTLITGESGVGKELVARAIHDGNKDRKGTFIPVNCSAVPKELMESLFFGHCKGAFTGATSDMKGYLELANGGTLFLDEVSEMPMELQAKLLRVLEDGIIQPLGSGKQKKLDHRVIAASNADFAQRIEAGSFREDLYFRLARFTVEVPPLRDRTEDIAILSTHFIRQFSEELKMPRAQLSQEALLALESYDFPGNIRELKNILERAMIESEGEFISPEHLHFFHKTRKIHPQKHNDLNTGDVSSDTLDIPLNLADAEEQLIQRALKQSAGNIAAAARLLGIHRSKLYRRIKPSFDS